MIWLTWRQLRVQLTTAACALCALSIFLVILGVTVHHAYHQDLATCVAAGDCTAARIAFTGRFETERTLLSCLILVLPGLLGAFWGAPLLTRELEHGTHRLAWTQGVTRRAWLAPKLIGITLTCVAVTGAAAMLTTWALAPLDHVESRFAVLSFDARDVAPLGYAAFAATLGVATGLLVKRTLAALAVTLAMFAAVQIAVPLALRSHLEAPVHRTLMFDNHTIAGHPLTFDFRPGKGTSFVGYALPGAWLLHRSQLLDPAGRPADLHACLDGSPSPRNLVSCMTQRHLHWTLSYQPPGRYWAFQWIETGAFMLVAVGLGGFALWRIPQVTT